MKIPGLDDALSRLDNLNENMIPLLVRIADGVDRLVEVANKADEWMDRNE